MIADQNFHDTCFTIFYPTASATAYGQRPKFFRAEHSATAEGENCSNGPTLFQVNGKLVHCHATAFEHRNFTNFGDKFFMNLDKISPQCNNVYRCLEPCTI